MNFNYQKAYFTLALPAFKALNHKQRDTHSKLRPLIGELNQGPNLNIPMTPAIEAYLNDLTCQELSELSRASCYTGHWYPGHGVEKPFETKRGESWKITNVCDQVLRKRFAVPHNIQIHEGKLRVTFSNRDMWIWEEFGLATEKNLGIFKTCGLPFGADTLKDSAEKLKALCGDLWPDVDTVSDNPEYLAFKLVLKNKALEKLKQDQKDKLLSLEKAKHVAVLELEAFTWLVEHDVPIDNCIYYDHKDVFCFGWRQGLTQAEKADLDTVLVDFPYHYEFK